MSSIYTENWTKLLGTSYYDLGKALTTGSDGSIYIAGYTNGDLDGQTNNQLLFGGSGDAFISKYNPDGTKNWTKLLGTSDSEEPFALTTGEDGSIYIAGQTNGDLDGQTDPNGTDAFLSKFNSDGDKQWTKLLGASSTRNEGDTINDDGYALTTGSDGSIYIAGRSWGNLDGQTNRGGYDAFLSKFNSDGDKQWTKLLGSPDWEQAYALTTGLDGSIYIAGSAYGDLDGQTSSGDADAFLSKFNSDGDKQWTKLLGSSYDPYSLIRSSTGDQANALTTGLDGSIYIAGQTTGDYLDEQISSGKYEVFISKYNPDGTKDWTRLLGSSRDDKANALTTGLDGSIYIAGETNGDLDGQTNSGNNDVFISKYNPDGTKDWTRLLGSSYSLDPYRDDKANALTTGLDGSIYIAGYTNGNLGGQTNNGSIDAFLTKLVILHKPTNIILSTSSFNENINVGSVVATLSTTDQDASDTHTYELVSGDGETDNDAFTIDGSNLKINSSPDYETQSSYYIRLKTTDNGGLTYEEAFTFNVNDLIDDGIEVASINNNYTPDLKGFASISGETPVIVTTYEVGVKTTLDSIKDYGGNLHAGDNLEETASSYKYQGLLDVNGDGVFEGIFTNNVSRRWVTAKVDSLTGQVDYGDHGNGGGTRVVGIYEDPLIAEGEKYGGFLSDGETPAPAAYGAIGSDRYVDLNGDGDFDDNNEDRLALNSQVRFQNDLDIDNLNAKHSGDYNGDGIHEVYWKTNDGTAYLRALMHDDGNIRYANYQSEEQMSSYLTGEGHSEIISDIL